MRGLNARRWGDPSVRAVSTSQTACIDSHAWFTLIFTHTHTHISDAGISSVQNPRVRQTTHISPKPNFDCQTAPITHTNTAAVTRAHYWRPHCLMSKLYDGQICLSRDVSTLHKTLEVKIILMTQVVQQIIKMLSSFIILSLSGRSKHVYESFF